MYPFPYLGTLIGDPRPYTVLRGTINPLLIPLGHAVDLILKAASSDMFKVISRAPYWGYILVMCIISRLLGNFPQFNL